jgi:hypothetical protein
VHLPVHREHHALRPVSPSFVFSLTVMIVMTFVKGQILDISNGSLVVVRSSHPLTARCLATTLPSSWLNLFLSLETSLTIVPSNFEARSKDS